MEGAPPHAPDREGAKEERHTVADARENQGGRATAKTDEQTKDSKGSYGGHGQLILHKALILRHLIFFGNKSTRAEKEERSESGGRG